RWLTFAKANSPFPFALVHLSPYFRRSATPTPRARASRSATSSDNLCRVPASSWAIYPCVTSARAASFAWVQPFSFRSRLIIAPGLLAIEKYYYGNVTVSRRPRSPSPRPGKPSRQRHHDATRRRPRPASRDLSPGTTESWRVVAKFCHGDRPSLGPRSVPGTDRVVAKVYAQGALYEAGGVNHEIHRELVVDSSSRVVAT